MKKTIRKSIELKASKEKVWEVLHQEKYNTIWYEEFSEGCHAVTDWKVGSKVVFKDESGGGLAGIIAENRPFEILAIEYKGIVIDGKEDYESEGAKQVNGFFESYTLLETGSAVQLQIASDMSEDYYEYMAGAWDKALIKIKQLAEAA